MTVYLFAYPNTSTRLSALFYQFWCKEKKVDEFPNGLYVESREILENCTV